MKVHSTVPFEFRGGLVLPKGESEFNVDALNPDDRAFFDGLVKAEVVMLSPPSASPSADDPPPPPPAVPPPPPADPISTTPAVTVEVATTKASKKT